MSELQRHQDDFTHHEDLGKSNRPKTEGRDNHRRRAVRFHAGQRDNWCHICSEAGDRETPEMQKELHLVFVDLEKTYDRVPRQDVWRCLREQGVPEKYVRLVKDTYEDARTQVKTSIGLTARSRLETDYIKAPH